MVTTANRYRAEMAKKFHGMAAKATEIAAHLELVGHAIEDETLTGMEDETVGFRGLDGTLTATLETLRAFTGAEGGVECGGCGERFWTTAEMRQHQNDAH